MFQTWAPYTPNCQAPSFQLIRLERWISGFSKRELDFARISPVHLEPLSWVDTYRCKEAILECKKQFALVKANYDAILKIQREQGWDAVAQLPVWMVTTSRCVTAKFTTLDSY